MKLKYALMAAGAFVAAPVVAFAQPVQGLYVGAGAGIDFFQNQTIKGFNGNGGAFAGTNPKFAPGFAGMGSIGYGLGNGLRIEVEGDYLRSNMRSVSGPTVNSKGKGLQEQYGAFLNVLYDIDMRPYGVPYVHPYVGVGAGWQENSWQNVGIISAPVAGAPALSVNKTVNGFAYQVIAGLSVPFDMLYPGLAMTLEYHFVDMPLDRKYGAALLAGPAVTGGKLKVADDFAHVILVGLRYAFNVAPPPPPPAPAPVAAPAPAPSRTYLVFFDWDKADLTDRARQIIAEAAQNSTRVQVTRIEVNGYTDLSGSPAYNQKLSVRRAQAVAAELVRDGVPQNEIVAQGFGESNPLVPTAKGVREPQNRRVEIILK